MRYLQLFLIFLTPIVVIPGIFNPFEAPKVLFVQICILGLLLVQFWQNNVKSELKHKQYFFILFAIVGVSIVHFFINPTATILWGNQFRMQGTVLMWCLLLYSYLVGNTDQLVIPSRIPIVVISVLLLSGFLLGVEGIGRAIGTIGEPNAFAATLLGLWPFVFVSNFRQEQKKRRLFFILLSALIFIGVFISGSKSGIFGFVLQLLLVVILFKTKLSIQKSLVICALISLPMFYMPFRDASVFENRGEVWKTAWVAGWEKPLLGWGFGNVEYALEETAYEQKNNLRWQYVDSAHNLLLDWWVQAGIVGVISIVMIYLLAIKKMIRHNRKFELVQLVGISTVMMFNPVSVVTLVLFWWLMSPDLAST